MKDKKIINILLIIFSILCVLTHFSVLYETSLESGDLNGEAARSILYPLYSCNILMYLLLILSFIKKDSKFFRFVAPAVFWLGIIGGLVSCIDYATSSGGAFRNFERGKSFLSHMFLALGSVMLVFNLKFNYKHIISICVITAAMMLLGIIENAILINFYDEVNAMYFRYPMIDGVPITNGYIVMLVQAGGLSAIIGIWELIRYLIKKKNKPVTENHNGE